MAERAAQWWDLRRAGRTPSPVVSSARRQLMSHVREARTVDAQVSLAERWVRDGRHARGYARLRALVGVCRRRGQIRLAARVALALSRSLLARGDGAGAQSVLAEVRDDCAGDERLAVGAAVMDGWVWLDRAELGRAEAALRAAVEGARLCGERTHLVSSLSVLAWCAFWQGRYAEAFEWAAASAEDGPVKALAVQARAAIGLGDRALARRCANDARTAAEGQADPDLLYQAAYAGAWVALCEADYRGVERMAAIACAAVDAATARPRHSWWQRPGNLAHPVHRPGPVRSARASARRHRSRGGCLELCPRIWPCGAHVARAARRGCDRRAAADRRHRRAARRITRGLRSAGGARRVVPAASRHPWGGVRWRAWPRPSLYQPDVSRGAGRPAADCEDCGNRLRGGA